MRLTSKRLKPLQEFEFLQFERIYRRPSTDELLCVLSKFFKLQFKQLFKIVWELFRIRSELFANAVSRSA